MGTRAFLLKLVKMGILILAMLSYVRFASAEETYYPYPIVFVHGINSSDSMWIDMRDALRSHFRNGLTNQGIEQYKYPDQISELNYFIGCDYEEFNNGDIKEIANYELGSKIVEALSYYPASIPENERKVIIVCHSMGGLVARRLLKQATIYKKIIDRIIFIDTPHLGSPYASAVWLFNEIVKASKEDPQYKSVEYHSYSAFSPFAITLANAEYPSIRSKIHNTTSHIEALLYGRWGIEKKVGIKPDGKAIEQLRIPGFVYYEAIYTGFADILTVTIYKSHTKSETFLGNDNLDVPADYKIIRGENDLGTQIVSWRVADLLNFSDAFTFPVLAGEEQSIDNAIGTGDGIVTKSSQETLTLDGTGHTDYTVSGFHVEIANKTAEPVHQSPPGRVADGSEHAQAKGANNAADEQT